MRPGFLAAEETGHSSDELVQIQKLSDVKKGPVSPRSGLQAFEQQFHEMTPLEQLYLR